MGNKVDLIEEIRTRLANGIASGQPLYGVKRIKIGSSEEARKLNDYPIINIRVLSGEESIVASYQRGVDEMTIEIALMINKKDSTSNLLYSTSGETGSIYLLEKLLNVLDKNTSGSVDLGYNNTANSLRTYSYNIDESNESLIIIRVEMVVQTLQFALGGR